MVQNGALNFVITDAAVYASLQSAVELRPLAGLVYPEAADADHMTASVAFTAQHEAGSLSLAEIFRMFLSFRKVMQNLSKQY